MPSRKHRLALGAALVASFAIGLALLLVRNPTLSPPASLPEHRVAMPPTAAPQTLPIPPAATGSPSPTNPVGGSTTLDEARRAQIAALYTPPSWRDALHEALTLHRGDGLEHDRKSAWIMVSGLCRRSLSIERAESQWAQRGLASPEGRQSLAMLQAAAAVHCEGFEEAWTEPGRTPLLMPWRPVDDPELDLAAALATAESPHTYGHLAASLVHRPVLPAFEREAGISALPVIDQRRIRRVATLEAMCTIFPTGCGPGGLTTLQECFFDHRCRPGVSAPQLMAEHFGLNPQQRALAFGLGRAMVADYEARRRTPGRP